MWSTARGPRRASFPRGGVEAPPAVLVEERPFMPRKGLPLYRALALVPSAFSDDFPQG